MPALAGPGLSGLVGLLALVLAWTAWRGYRLARSPVLARFAAAYFLLAASQAAFLLLDAAARASRAIPTRGADVFDALFWAYYGAQVAGWLLLLSTFDRRKFRGVLAAGPVLLVAGPILQATTIVLLFLVVLHAGLNHIEEARRGSLQTALGYGLLLLGHFLFLFGYEPLSPRSWPGELACAAGFVALLARGKA